MNGSSTSRTPALIAAPKPADVGSTSGSRPGRAVLTAVTVSSLELRSTTAIAATSARQPADEMGDVVGVVEGDDDGADQLGGVVALAAPLRHLLQAAARREFLGESVGDVGHEVGFGAGRDAAGDGARRGRRLRARGARSSFGVGHHARAVAAHVVELVDRVPQRRRVTTSNCSRQATGLPGKLMISVVPRRPLTARDSIACGVLVSDAARIASAKPGASRSKTSRVASGVTSRDVNPVPPVVRMRLAHGAIGVVHELLGDAAGARRAAGDARRTRRPAR